MYDVIIIGAGISGATIARSLSKYHLNVLIMEKEFDVATEATMANSAIVHAGHDPLPGTLKAKFNLLGNKMYPKMSEELDIPFMRCGGMVVATDQEEIDQLDVLYDRALQNGLSPDEVSLLNREEILEKEPNIADGVIKALYLPTTAVTFPWEAAIANIENAMDNGVHLEVECKVEGIQKEQDYFLLQTTKGPFKTKVVINATGIFGDDVTRLFTEPHFEIHPRRGEYYVLDKHIYEVNSVLYPCPTEKGKGVIITPQYHGNVLIGPTSEFVEKNEVHITTPAGLEYIKEHAEKTVKNIPYHKVIRSFAGGRAASTTKDFVIEDINKSGFINCVGMESPGLTAAPAVAEYVVEELVRPHFELKLKKDYNPRRKKVMRISEFTNEQLNELVQQDERFGKIVCRCEKITEGEIIDAIRRNCGARSVVGVKNRVRAGAGRCQGGFCQTEVIRILSEELHIDKMDVNYSKSGSNILKARTKGE